MSQEAIQNLKLFIAGISLYYGKELPDMVIGMYAEDLQDLPFERVKEAYREIAKSSGARRMPLPGEIRALINPIGTDSAEDDAREAASRIGAAVSKFGWNNETRAQEYIGELGWQVVTMQGGWATLCESLTFNNSGILAAQWRELAEVLRKKARNGTLGQPPTLLGGGVRMDQKQVAEGEELSGNSVGQILNSFQKFPEIQKQEPQWGE